MRKQESQMAAKLIGQGDPQTKVILNWLLENRWKRKGAGRVRRRADKLSVGRAQEHREGGSVM